MRSNHYLDFIRTQPCANDARLPVSPHHPLKRLRGISEAGLAQKGADYLAIPLCDKCHDAVHAGHLKWAPAELFEWIVIYLICYLNTLPISQSGRAGNHVG